MYLVICEIIEAVIEIWLQSRLADAARAARTARPLPWDVPEFVPGRCAPKIRHDLRIPWHTSGFE